MSGKVVLVKGAVVSVRGLVGGENKIVEFVVTLPTVFRKTIIGISADQIKSGEPFKPQTQILRGNIYDLMKDTDVRIKTKDNLLSVNRATATEIKYTKYDFPN